MKRVIFFAIIFSAVTISLGLTSCDNDTEIKDPNPFTLQKENYTFLKNSNYYLEVQKNRSPEYSDPFEIEDVQRIDKEMHIEVSFPAGCASNNFEIIWDGVVMESYPPQTRLFVKRTAGNCNKSDEREHRVLVIDLEEIFVKLRQGDPNLQDAIFIVSNASKRPDTGNADMPVSNN